MNEHCLKNGSTLLVLIDFPLTDADRSYWDTHCRDVKAHYVYEYLQTRQNESRRMARIPDDGHWSLFGHQWVAEYLRDRILSLEGFKAKPTDGARYPFSHSGTKSPLPPL
jgi:hypothetical protein